LGKKEKITEGRKGGRASKNKPPRPLAQGLDPPLASVYTKKIQVANKSHIQQARVE